MRALSLACAAVAVLAATSAARGVAPKWHQLTAGYTFTQYMQHFNKVYSHKNGEYKKREAMFHTQLKRILKHNSERHSYKMGVNKFTDFTKAEQKRMLGTRGVAAGEDKGKHSQAFVSSGRPIPSYPVSVDYRLHSPPVLTAVKDQGSCGDCWAHSVTETVESAWALATGNLFVLSTGQVTDCTPQSGNCYSCGGSLPSMGYDYVIAAGGLTEEWIYPFSNYQGSEQACQNASTTQVMASITAYKAIQENSYDEVIRALNELGPLGVGVYAEPWLDNSYESGVFDACVFGNSTNIDHAVQLVGYGHDEDLNMDYWIVRNSWNAGWGENGFIRLHRNSTPTCGTRMNDYCVSPPTPPTSTACGQCMVLASAKFAVATAAPIMPRVVRRA